MECFEKKAMEILGRTPSGWEYAAVAAVFRACYNNSMTKEHIKRVVVAIHGPVVEDQDFDKALRKMVREKILRSRTERGRRYYEINF